MGFVGVVEGDSIVLEVLPFFATIVALLVLFLFAFGLFAVLVTVFVGFLLFVGGGLHELVGKNVIIKG